ncbi:HvfC/BufC family peptide modification chaperone [Sorangium sp. So ce1000]|uniref:HvfC/BufC family peptide modification chaperone n=1 Tax=Sorangium sp. So ce1000 TaxID=3133325 RepID=UPI003F5D8653
MQDRILHPDPLAQADAVRGRIAPPPTPGPQERLLIYQRGYVARLLQCMEGQFKALCHTLGKQLFADFVAEYLKVHPSRSRTLADLGARFPLFLEQTRPDAELEPSEREAWIDFMIDLARHEWAIYAMWDVEGNEGKPSASIFTPDRALRLLPCLSLHHYSFPVDTYYQAVAEGKSPNVPGPDDLRLAILRKDFRIGTFRLTVPQYDFLLRMKDVHDIASALDQTAAQHGASRDVAVEAFGRWRTRWIEQGFFVEA